MKIEMMSNVCYAIGQLLRACDNAEITQKDVKKLCEMDNEFASYVNSISQLFTVEPSAMAYSMPFFEPTPRHSDINHGIMGYRTCSDGPFPHPIYEEKESNIRQEKISEILRSEEPGNHGMNTSFGGYCAPFIGDDIPTPIEEINTKETIKDTHDIDTKENIDEVNENNDVERRKYNVKPNDYPEAVEFIKINKDMITNDINSAYDKYVESTTNSCTKKIFLEIVDMIYPDILSLTTEEIDDCIFVLSPYEGILVNKRGDIRVYDKKKKEYRPAKVSMCNGFMMFSYNHKRYTVGRVILSTFAGEMSKSYRVIYKDNNRKNCALSNLEWSIMSPRTEAPTSDMIEMLCKIIVELFEKNSTIHTEEIVKLSVDNKINITSKAVHRIISGRHKDITDKYFDYRKITVKNGTLTMNDEVIDDTVDETDNETVDDDMDLTDIITDNNGDILSLVKFTQDLEYGKKLFLAKSKMNMLLGNNDFIIPIMYCLRDENGNIRHPNDILKAIRNEFGKFFITYDFVSKVLFKEYLPEVTDIWFSKEEINK